MPLQVGIRAGIVRAAVGAARGVFINPASTTCAGDQVVVRLTVSGFHFIFRVHGFVWQPSSRYYATGTLRHHAISARGKAGVFFFFTVRQAAKGGEPPRHPRTPSLSGSGARGNCEPVGLRATGNLVGVWGAGELHPRSTDRLLDSAAY